MGIFNKKPPKPPAKPEVETKAEEKVEGRYVTGTLPKGFDLNNREMVKKFLIDTLKEAGALPEGINLDNVEVESSTVGSNQMEGLERVAYLISHFHSMKSTNEIKDLQQPADPPKGEFIRCFNNFHRHLHEMSPLAADLLQSLECMKLNLEGPGVSKADKERFTLFSGMIIDIADALGKFGEMTCQLHKKVGDRGLPIPDSSSNTIN